MADEHQRSVDVDERRDNPPPAGTRPAVLASAGSKLSPVQQAYAGYVEHATACTICRDVDGGRCEAADMLWQAFRQRADGAYQQLADGTS